MWWSLSCRKAWAVRIFSAFILTSHAGQWSRQLLDTNGRQWIRYSYPRKDYIEKVIDLIKEIHREKKLGEIEENDDTIFKMYTSLDIANGLINKASTLSDFEIMENDIEKLAARISYWCVDYGFVKRKKKPRANVNCLCLAILNLFPEPKRESLF